MNASSQMPLLAALVGAALLLASGVQVPAAGNQNATGQNDLRYYVYVSGIT